MRSDHVFGYLLAETNTRVTVLRNDASQAVVDDVFNMDVGIEGFT